MIVLCSKSDRKITFDQFNDALKLLAEKKYPGDPNGVNKLSEKITSGSGPSAHGVTVSYHREKNGYRFI